MKRLLHVVIVILLLIIPGTASEQFWAVYFTTPHLGKIRAVQDHPETVLKGMIDDSSREVIGAFYELTSPVIILSLVNAFKRGVDVKIVVDTDNVHEKAFQDIIAAGIPVVDDQRSGIMHNKFCIIDREIVWTGSYNLTRNGGFKNNNNAISIRSKELAGIFRTEFFEMFTHRIFGNRKEFMPFPFLLNRYHVAIQGSKINVYFSPEDDIETIIIKRLRGARRSIHFMAFSFTSNDMGEEIIRAHKRGVKVKGIFEKRGAGTRYSEFVKMKLEGVPVMRDENPYAMHHKVIIIDETIVITGSYNYSKSARIKNDENVIIFDHAGVAMQYLDEFKRLYR